MPAFTTPDILSALAQVDWFADLPAEVRPLMEATIAEAIEERQGVEGDGDSVWSQYPATTLISIHGDAECIYGEGDYAELVREFAAGSWGLFQPTDVTETWADLGDRGEATLRFRHRGRDYQTRISSESGDYIAEEFWDLMERAFRDCEPSLELHCPDVGWGQDFGLIVTTPGARQRAQAAGLLPPAPTHGLFGEALDDADEATGARAEDQADGLLNLMLGIADPDVLDYLPRHNLVADTDGHVWAGFENGRVVSADLGPGAGDPRQRVAVTIGQLPKRITAIDVDRDRRRLAAIDIAGNLAVWDLEDGRELWRHAIGDAQSVGRLVQFSPESDLVGGNVISLDQLAQMANGHDAYFAATDGSELQADGEARSHWLYNPYGDILRTDFAAAVIGKQSIILKGEDVLPLGEHAEVARCIRFSPDHSFVACGCDHGSLRVHAVADGSLSHTYDEANPIFGLCWLGADRIAMLFKHYVVRFRELADGQRPVSWHWDADQGCFNRQ